ncbi:MAG TPA: IS3 family transposase [Acidimicrobiales bacterium]|nr:IS3 family transposase [Acidimicrobiales bacterium]
MRVFAFVDRQKADFAVRTLCRVCRVSTSGYYTWAAREAAGPTTAQRAEEDVVAKIRLVHDDSRRNYGEPRITAQLARDGVMVNHKRVARLMAKAAIRGKGGRRKVRTTVQDPNATPFTDLVERDFVRHGLDQLWFGDLTYVATDEGWLYLSAVTDACSRRLLGWSITDHLRTEGPLDALHAAVDCRGGDVAGVVFHSDKGCQYTSADYTAACAGYGVTQSMGSVGDSYDNAQAESVWAGFKREAIDGEHFATKAQARRAIFSWVVWYNSTRLHTSIGKRPPIEYERHLQECALAA